MDKQPVGQLPDLASSNNDDEIMVITNSEYSQLKKEKISDLITDFTSTNENNALTKGTDGKMFVTDFGNASNITKGTLPVSVLPDIPKDKLPEIETDDLPDSGITAGTYTYPTDIVVNSKGQVTSITEGQAGANNANQDLSNLGPLGLDKLNQSKALETGSVSSDADVYADVLKYKNSGTGTGIDTIKPDNYEVVGTPTITDDGIASGFKSDSYIISTENFNLSAKKFKIKYHCKIGKLTDSIGVVGLYNKQGLPVINTLYNYYTVGVILRENSSGAGDISTYTSGHTGLSYTANFEIENNTVTINVLYDDGTTRTANVDFSELDVSSWGELQLRIGRCLWIGENIEYLDLNSVELENNGNLIYQPCLKIPYTESKTGSKIVDAAYRDRVQDMYEQYGYAPYYTIDEENENFTLPMGEIYGMIERKKSNDGFSLFDTKLTDRILTGDEAVGWALQGSLITMTYPDAVNKIKELYAGGTDTTFRGISCKKTTDGRYIADISQKTAIDNLFNTTGVADFYILDSTNSEFYLPRNNWFLQAGSDTGAVNNYNAPGLPGISGNIGKFDVYEGYASGCFTIKNTSHGDTREQWEGTVADIGFNASQSSSVYGASSSVQPPSSIKLLYYKVGNTVPNTGLIDIGHVLSDIQQLSKSYITETYINGPSWYRVWSDGWIEQGGRLQIQASTQASVNLMKPYSDTNYAAFCSHSLPGTGNQAESYIQQTSASVVSIGNSCGNEQTFTWMCAGK